METPNPAADPRNMHGWKGYARNALGGVWIGGAIDARVLCVTELK